MKKTWWYWYNEFAWQNICDTIKYYHKYINLNKNNVNAIRYRKKVVQKKQLSQQTYLTGTNTKFTHMCTGGNLVVRQNLVVLWKQFVGWKNWILSAILQWKTNQ